MAKKDPRIDAYIAKAAPFAKPILTHLRALVHKGCPEVEETMKWSAPHFDYKGIMCGMSAFKEHCAFGFWKGALIIDKKTQKAIGLGAAGNFGHIRSLDDLPADSVIVGYVKEAARLNEEGIASPMRKAASPKPAPKAPKYMLDALAKNKKAMATFDAFSPSCKREYVEWITEAKSDETRDRRLAQAIEWMAEGKKRNWKYER